jgi:hypothetical protein
MTHLFTHVGRRARLRASLVALVVLAGACDSTNDLASPSTAATLDGIVADSAPAAPRPDSLVIADSLAIAADSLAPVVDAPAFSMAIYSSGARFGSYDCTPAGLAAYNMCNRSAGAWSAKEIRALEALNAKVILNQGGYAKFKDGRGRYSATKYYQWVQSLRPYAAAWRPFVANGTLKGVQLIDDRLSHNWGGVSITNAQIDQMAKWWKQLLPGVTTLISGGYAWNLQGYKFYHLDGTINQYNARYMGDVRAWRDRSLAAARSAGVSIILSLNVLDGGKIVRGCHRGGSSKTCSMSPTELRTYGAAIAAAPGVCAIGTWKHQSAYHSQPGVLRALKYIAGLAAQRPELSCRRR